MAEVKTITTTGAVAPEEPQMAALRTIYQNNFPMLSDARRSLADGAAVVLQSQQALLRSAAAQAETVVSGAMRPPAAWKETPKRPHRRRS